MPFEGRGVGFVYGDGFFAVGAEDGHGDVGGAARGGGVGEAHLVFPGFGDIEEERQGFGFRAVAVVEEVAVADVRADAGGLFPGSDALGLGVVHDDAG